MEGADEAVGIEDGLARPVLLALAKPKTLPTDCSYPWIPLALEHLWH